ncbi:MAG TPA: ATPase, T2SS/T4P/T4SS family, partial [Noviherbaspirillum sp.]|nr:ATPase, T2SS/T4P/T4SS family [Noviherbaspirillum sp.]
MNAVAATNVNLVGITGIARRLVMDGAMDETNARAAMANAAESKLPLAQWITEKKLVSAPQMAAANAIEFGMPLLDVSAFDPAHNALKLVSDELVQKHQVLPLFKRGNRLFVGVSDPTRTHSLDEIKFHTNLVVEPILVDEDSLRRALEQWSNLTDNLSNAFGSDDDGLESLDITSGDDDNSSSDAATGSKEDDTPVVKFVNKMLVDAIKRGASDIHFEPYEADYRVRQRIDGILKQVAKAPVKLNMRITARLKVMAQLDIAEKRVPQDGRMKLNLSKTKQVDFRVSTLPTLFGEKVVLRILDGSAAKLGIEKLGY